MISILYFKSGGIPEYCDGYGVKFENNFEEKILEMIDKYDFYKEKLIDYPFSADVMCREFLDKFIKVKEEKILIDSKIYSIVLYSYLLKNKIQKMFTGLTIKQYLKQNIKRFVQ